MKVDLKSAFNQLRVLLGCEGLTTLITKFGKFKWNVIPFGLSNAPGHFQDLMNWLFHDKIGNGLWIYIDDILVYEEDPVKHRALLQHVLQVLRENKLVANLAKCEFEVE